MSMKPRNRVTQTPTGRKIIRKNLEFTPLDIKAIQRLQKRFDTTSMVEAIRLIIRRTDREFACRGKRGRTFVQRTNKGPLIEVLDIYA